MKPHPHQIEFTNKIIKAISVNKRVVAQLSTGGGKTVVFSYFLQRFLLKNPSAKTAIVVHREELQEQTISTLKRFGIVNVSVYMVESFNNQIKKHGLKELQFIIIDECHTGNFKKIIDHYRETETKIIGFSATPVYATKKHPINVDYEEIVTGMPIQWLIDNGFLTHPIHYGGEHIDKKSLKKSGGDYTLESLAVEFSKPKLIDAVVQAYEKYCLNKKSIIFNTTIEHANLVNEAFMKAGYLARTLDSKCSHEERKSVLRWLKETPNAILNNVSILTTGFDEPSIEAVIFNRCTKSLPLWLQCCGRSARIYPGKDHFIIVDLGENIIGEGHDYWNAKYDWEYKFHNPAKAGEGPPPMKVCPNKECEAMIYMSATKCPHCGHLMLRETVYTDVLFELKLLPDNPVKKNSSIALDQAIEEVAVKVSRVHDQDKPALFEQAVKNIYASSSFELKPYVLNHLKQRYAKYCA